MSYLQKDEKETRRVAGVSARGLGIRHMQIAVMSAAAFMAYVLRTDLSVAIVAMVDTHDHATDPLSPTFDWDEHIQGYVLSSFFWGYLITQIPAGILTERFGGHFFLCAGIIASSLLTLVFPLCAYFGGWMLVCANRTLQGISQGLIFPAIYTLLGVWSPPAERSRLTSLSLSAPLLGTVASSPLSGFLCSWYGWSSVFYIFGGVGAFVGVVAIFLGANSPSKHRMISHDEKDYIQTSLGGAKQEKLRVPWKIVFTSVPYYAAISAMAFRSAVFITFLTKIPTFLGTVLKYGMEGNGVLSAFPFLASWILTFVFSWTCDVIIGRGWLQLTAARKLFNSIAHFGSAVCLVLLANSDDRVLSVVLLALTIGCNAGSVVGVSAGFVDLAPNFSGTIFGISNFVASSLGVCGPIVVGYIVTETGSVEEWRYVFYLCAMLLTLSNVGYLIWGTSETQWWNWPDRYKDEEDYRKKREKEELSRKSAC